MSLISYLGEKIFTFWINSNLFGGGSARFTNLGKLKQMTFFPVSLYKMREISDARGLNLLWVYLNREKSEREKSFLKGEVSWQWTNGRCRASEGTRSLLFFKSR